MSEPAVVDSSAILCLLGGEAGSATVAERLPEAAISAVNLSEVVAVLADRGMKESEIRTVLGSLGLAVHPFDAEVAILAGTLRPKTKALRLSLGDRACIALGMVLSRPLVTAEKTWKSLKLGVRVEVVR